MHPVQHLGIKTASSAYNWKMPKTIFFSIESAKKYLALKIKVIYPVQGADLEVFPLNKTRDEEDPDGKEADEEEGEDHLDVRPRPEAEHAEQHQLSHLGRGIFIFFQQ